MIRKSWGAMQPVLAAVEYQVAKENAAWLAERLGKMPLRWADQLRADFERRGGFGNSAACAWLLGVTEAGGGRLALSAGDEDLRAAAKEAASEGMQICNAASVASSFSHVGFVERVVTENAAGKKSVLREWSPGLSVPSIGGRAELASVGGFGRGAALQMLGDLCGRWGIEPAQVSSVADVLPAMRRMTCDKWWLRRLRRAHGRRGEGAAISGGVVRRGLWPYASQDCVERRQAQRRRNAAALELASLENVDSGELIKLADVVAGSVANPEIKRGELMTRVRGADEYAEEKGWSCEFWTLTAPSRFHAQKVINATAEPNPNFAKNEAGEDIDHALVSPRAAARYLSKVWSRARAAWARRGLLVAGLRTAEPHHDGCPHWHLITYGPARDLRFARRLLRVYAMRDCGQEQGAKKHRFNYQKAHGGKFGAAYAAKYIAKNIDGFGMESGRDQETGRKQSSAVQRVDAWASAWGIRQFQFFGMPKIGIWRALRKVEGPLALVGSALERARAAADDGDFRRFWLACMSGPLELLKRDEGRLTQYGDKAAAVVAGVVEGGRRALLPVRNWLIHWRGKELKKAVVSALDVVFDLPRSGVINCTRGGFGDDLGAACAALGY